MTSFFAVLLSSLALGVSLFTLWKTHLAPFKLQLANDSPTFSIYKIREWWIPSIDINFTFLNVGSRGGKISDIRLVATLDTGSDNTVIYPFYATWIVDFPKFHKHYSDRGAWIEEAILRDWYPVYLKSGDQQQFHIVFEGEGVVWNSKLSGRLTVRAEIYTSENNEWSAFAHYRHELEPLMFDRGDKYGLRELRPAPIRDLKWPEA